MMKILRKIRVFKVTEQRLADQSRVIRTNDWLSEVELDEIQGKIKEEKNTEEPRTELQNMCDQQRSQGENDIELKNIENVFKYCKIRDLDEIRLVEVVEQMKTDKPPPNLINVDRITEIKI